MPHVAWTLDDYSTGSQVTYSFVINPNEFQLPLHQANITTQVTTAPNGQALIFQGRKNVGSGRMSGTTRTPADFANLNTWLSKEYPLVLTDDLGDTYDILFTSLEWERVSKHMFKYDWTADFLVIS